MRFSLNSYKILFCLLMLVFSSILLEGQVTAHYFKIVGYSNNGDSAWIQLCELEVYNQGIKKVLVLENNSPCYTGECWDNSIDKDTNGWAGTTSAEYITKGYNEIWAIYTFKGGGTVIFDEVRIKTDCNVTFNSRWLKSFSVAVAGEDSIFYTVIDTSLGSNGNWQSFNISTTGCAVHLGKDTSLCSGDSLTLFADNSFNNYLWQDNSTDSIFTVNKNGTYWLKASKPGCTVYDTLLITENQLPIVDLGNDTILCKNMDSIALFAGNNFLSYLWSNGDTTNTIVVFENSYSVTVTDTNYCTNSDTIVVFTQVCDGMGEYSENNLFFQVYPNPTNGKFEVSAQNCVLPSALEIYNTLGQTIFVQQLRKSQETIYVMDLPKGMYFILLYSAKQTIHKRILIQ